MANKKLDINLNDFPEWSEINWINFEIDNTIDALRKSIEINQNSFNEICNDLELKISKLRKDNNNLNHQELDGFIEHLHGLEERIIVELNEVQNSSTVIYAFAIFENKLKMITEKIKNEFEFQLPTRQGDSYVSNYWKILKSFLEVEIDPIEKNYTKLKNQMVLRHVIIHQNNMLKDNQHKTLSRVKNIKLNEVDGNHYLVNIENIYLETLVVLVTTFFKELIIILTHHTNKIYKERRLNLNL